MCGGQTRAVSVGGMPVDVEICADYAHARGLVQLPLGTVVAVEVKASPAEMPRRLARVAERLQIVARRMLACPELSPLFLGLSLIAPGEQLAKPSKRAIGANRKAYDAGDIALANVLLLEMGNGARDPVGRRALEAQYADLAARVADAGQSLVALQRMANENSPNRSRDMVAP